LNSVGFMFCDQAPVDLRYIETKVWMWLGDELKKRRNNVAGAKSEIV